ncbi:uncharacterized protein LOC103313082 [Tribolium castaneum]|uniref:Uncharacterized protein n=1 Tax=Tribolium castaneum TaxID=7070 RepID=D6WKX3_TRICA|nr:PREDICTED: uncharacterized protein LOC103313082 [Tribolium castaneum]EFA04034.2 hypothetical protein TcasGA2_TC014263 [Tribolium castaneum]|eukprot:XP_008193632.1 PREDICTED: uncharacterized protein LOC103313082 [Tribolium castaneum]
MVDDSMDIEPFMEFHPCNIPHGMKDYILKDLTSAQQIKLNVRKREQIRTDQQYLSEHPEIRGLIVMILRLLMKKKPKYDIYEVIGQYFTKPSVDLKQDVYNYLDERSKVLAVNSTIIAVQERKESLGASVLTAIDEEEQKEENLETLVEDEEMEEKEEEHLIRWEKEELSDEVSAHMICEEVVNELVNNVFDEVDDISMGSIASIGFPVDYEDHAMVSVRSSEESIPSN